MGSVRSWNSECGAFDHVPIFLQVEVFTSKPLGPFKFNSHWLLDQEFKEMVKNECKDYDNKAKDFTMFRFSDNLK